MPFTEKNFAHVFKILDIRERFFKNYQFEIKSVLQINVRVRLMMSPHNKNLEFFIVKQNPLNEDCSGVMFSKDLTSEEIITQEEIIEWLNTEIVPLLSNIYYNKLNDSFLVKDEQDTDILLQEMEQFKECMENMSFNIDECSVCHEMTKCKTPCNHFLCTLCLHEMVRKSKLQRNQHACPVCRAKLLVDEYSDNEEE